MSTPCNHDHRRAGQVGLGVVLLIVALLVWMATPGCATWQDTAGKSLASASVSVDAAMKGWAVWVVNGHSTPQQEAAVRDAYGKYQSAMALASTAYQSAVAAKDKTLMKTALAVVAQSRADFVALVSTFTTTKAAP